MQNLIIATIIVLLELGVLGVAGICFLFLARRRSANERRGAGRSSDLKLLAHQLIKAQGALAAQYHVLFGEAAGEMSDSPARVLEEPLRKAIGQLRVCASQMARGRISTLQVAQCLLGLQDTLLAGMGELAETLSQRPAGAAQPRPEPRATAEAAPDSVAAQADSGPTAEEDAAQENMIPDDPEPGETELVPAREPETKTEVDIQAEIDALQRENVPDRERQPVAEVAPEPPKVDKSEAKGEAPHQDDIPETGRQPIAEVAPEPPKVKKSEAEIEAEMQAELEAFNASQGPLASRSTEDLQAELDAILNGDKIKPVPAPAVEPSAPAAPPVAKKTEAEIEAEMQAELEAFNASQGPLASRSTEDLQAELDAILNGDKIKPVPTPAVEPSAPAAKKTEAEIEAEMQAELEAFGASQGLAKPQSDEDLQAELDALLSGESKKPSPTPEPAPPAAPPAAKKTEAEIEAEMQAELEAFNASQGLAKPQSNEDLQAELDALLKG